MEDKKSNIAKIAGVIGITASLIGITTFFTGIVSIEDFRKIFDGSSTPETTSSSNGLSRQKAMELLRGRIFRNITVSISPWPGSPRIPDNISDNNGVLKAYGELISAGILECQGNSLFSARCKPGTNVGDLNIKVGIGFNMSFVSGRVVPSAVTGISMIDRSTTIADVALTFEPTSETYKHYQSVFDKINLDPPSDKDNEVVKVYFRLYDDGWRVERTGYR